LPWALQQQPGVPGTEASTAGAASATAARCS
jgi:hypothetical protein